MKNLILLHGALGHPDQFNPLIEILKTDFKIHPLLFMGHGTNDVSSHGFKINDLVEQLNAFIHDEKIENPLVFGYSMGGYVALCHALKYPGTIQSIMTLATKLEWSEAIALQEIKFLNPIVIAEKVPKYAAYLSKTHGVNQWEKLLTDVSEMMMDIGRSNFLNEQSLSRIEIPVQLMVGDKDNMVSIPETVWAFQSLTNSRMAVLPNTVHPFENVDIALLAVLMRAFLFTNFLKLT